MLIEQSTQWIHYPPEMRVIVVDDGSPEDNALDVINTCCDVRGVNLAVYRIKVDIPWNRNGARNLAAWTAITKWILHIDIDHVLIPEGAWALTQGMLSDKVWYRFERYRMGKADDTRQKDLIHTNARFGPIKPHIDSYLCTKEMYWSIGGYDEDFSGSLGGSSVFLPKLQGKGQCVFRDDVTLRVYTKDIIDDASDIYLDRSRERYSKIKATKKADGLPNPTTAMRFPWERVL